METWESNIERQAIHQGIRRYASGRSHRCGRRGRRRWRRRGTSTPTPRAAPTPCRRRTRPSPMALTSSCPQPAPARRNAKPSSPGLRRSAQPPPAAPLGLLAWPRRRGNRSGRRPSVPCIDQQQDSGGPGGSSRVPRGWSGERSDPPGQHVTAAAVLVGTG